jgi:hypothetical protein
MISEQEVVTQFLALLGAGIGTSVLLDTWAGHEFLIMLLTSCNSTLTLLLSCCCCCCWQDQRAGSRDAVPGAAGCKH